jgi:hypothetical protein
VEKKKAKMIALKESSDGCGSRKRAETEAALYPKPDAQKPLLS